MTNSNPKTDTPSFILGFISGIPFTLTLLLWVAVFNHFTIKPLTCNNKIIVVENDITEVVANLGDIIQARPFSVPMTARWFDRSQGVSMEEDVLQWIGVSKIDLNRTGGRVCDSYFFYCVNRGETKVILTLTDSFQQTEKEFTLKVTVK